MTGNQIAYWTLQETKRHNAATEQSDAIKNQLTASAQNLTKRGQDLTHSSNMANVMLGYANLGETNRHNTATEEETYRHNTATENTNEDKLSWDVSSDIFTNIINNGFKLWDMYQDSKHPKPRGSKGGTFR